MVLKRTYVLSVALALVASVGERPAAGAPVTWGVSESAAASAVDSGIRWDDQGRRALAHRVAPGGDGLAGQASGGDASDWQALGPFGGDIEDVAVSPTNADIVLAGLAPSGSSGGRLYRSVNGGDSWSVVPALEGISVFSIAFAPSGTAYVGSMDSVWKSEDNGATWAQLNLFIGPNDQVLVVTIDPNEAETIWIGIADALGGQTVNVMRSTNGGVSWADMTPPLGGAIGCLGIAVAPNDSNIVAASFGGGFGGGRVWVSTDGGETWINRSAGLPDRPMNDIVHDGARLLVVGGMAFGSQTVGVYSSADLGATWTPLHDASWPSLIINDVEVDPGDPNTIYVASGGSGVFRSTDGGVDWSFGIGGTGAMTVNSVRLSPGSATQLFIGGSSVAVLRSDDAGGSFEPASIGIGALNVEWVAVNGLNANELAIAFSGLNDGGVYTSLDGGATWTLEPVPGTRYNFVVFNPDGVLYAVSDGPSSIAPEGVYRRSPGGGWVNLGPDQGPAFESRLDTIEFSVSNPALILAGGSDFGNAGFEPTVWRSNDGAESWSKVYEGSIANDNVTDIAFVQDGNDFIVLASFTSLGAVQDGGVLRSNNSGLTWFPSETGLPFGAQCEALAASPTDVNTFYLADSDLGAGAVHVTTNAGATWSGTGFADRVSGIVIDPGDAATIYIMQPNAVRVQVSHDSGQTFSPFNVGLESAGFVRSIAGSFAGCPRLLLSTMTGTYATALPSDVNGDGDTDGDVDLFDFELFNACLGGGAETPCCAFDFDGSGAIDWADFGGFQIGFTGG